MPPRRGHSRRPVLRGAAATRRQFLFGSAATLSSVLLSNCARNLGSNSAPPESPAGELGAIPDNSNTANTIEANRTLYIYSWSSYVDDELLRHFEEKTGIKPIVDIYDSNEIMLAKLQAGGGSQYSIIYPSDYTVTQMIESNMLATIDPSRLKGLDQLLANWVNPVYDPGNTHSIPYAWGTTGLVYDPEQLGGSIRDFNYLWDNLEDLPRRVNLLNDVREVMGAVLKSIGYSYNSTDPQELEAAFEKLLELKPAIASFLTNGWEEQVAGGDLTISMAYSVDALSLIDENPNLTYVIPETGSSLWTDTMVIPKTAPNVDAAYEWMNYMLNADNSVELVQRLKFATPLRSTFNQLPADVKANDKLFPPEDLLAKCEGIAPIPQMTNDQFDRYWTQITSG